MKEELLKLYTTMFLHKLKDGDFKGCESLSQNLASSHIKPKTMKSNNIIT